MKLNTDDRMLAMAYCHARAVVEACRDLQCLRNGAGGEDQRVIASRSEGARNVAKDSAPIVVNLRGSSVDRLPADHLGPVGCTDHLMSQTDAEDGDLGPELSHDVETDSSPGRIARSGRKDDRLRSQRAASHLGSLGFSAAPLGS